MDDETGRLSEREVVMLIVSVGVNEMFKIGRWRVSLARACNAINLATDIYREDLWEAAGWCAPTTRRKRREVPRESRCGCANRHLHLKLMRKVSWHNRMKTKEERTAEQAERYKERAVDVAGEITAYNWSIGRVKSATISGHMHLMLANSANSRHMVLRNDWRTSAK